MVFEFRSMNDDNSKNECRTLSMVIESSCIVVLYYYVFIFYRPELCHFDKNVVNIVITENRNFVYKTIRAVVSEMLSPRPVNSNIERSRFTRKIYK